MISINPYLNFPGNTEEAFNFYRSVFGGEFSSLQRFRETPDSDKMPADVQDLIVHIALPISRDNTLMATDAPESLGFSHAEGTNMYICLNPDTAEEAKRLFNGLSEGGKIAMPLQEMFWGAMYGDFTDRFGIKWMVNYDLKKQTA